MTHAEFLKQLLPPGSYDSAGALIGKTFSADGARLDAVRERVADFMREIDPLTVLETLSDWERVYGLPDPCYPLGQTVGQRLVALALAVTDRGGLSRDYFIAKAAALGYPGATIEEFDAGTLGEVWRYVWRLHVPGTVAISSFRCGSRSGERLRSWGNQVFECVMNRLKPAHTSVLFVYGA